MSDLINENTNKKQRLGRGLGSLLGNNDNLNITEMPGPNPGHINRQNPITTNLAGQPAVKPTVLNTQDIQPAVPPEARVWQVGIEKLVASEFQPRSHFEKEKLEELAQSIKQNGILQPIVARKLASGRFEIIAGERRWRASQIAGLKEVPVILKALSDQSALELAIVENIQREDLNAIEEAEAYQRLATEFKLTQQQVAEKVGKERATVANSMRLLMLAMPIREMLVKNEISAGHAKVLLSLTNLEKQIEIAKRIPQQKLSVRQLEKIVASEVVEKAGAKKDQMPESNVTQRLISGLAEELQKILGTKVSIDYLNSKGKISVHFYSDEELTQLVDKLKERNGKH